MCSKMQYLYQAFYQNLVGDIYVISEKKKLSKTNKAFNRSRHHNITIDIRITDQNRGHLRNNQ